MKVEEKISIELKALKKLASQAFDEVTNQDPCLSLIDFLLEESGLEPTANIVEMQNSEKFMKLNREFSSLWTNSDGFEKKLIEILRVKLRKSFFVELEKTLVEKEYELQALRNKVERLEQEKNRASK